MRRQLLLAMLGLVALVWFVAAAAVLAAGSDGGDGGRDSGVATRGATASDGDAGPTSDAGPRSRAAQIQADLDMTRFMSRPDGPWTAMTAGRIADPQLERAHDPSYLRELEAAQRDIDRMLAVTP